MLISIRHLRDSKISQEERFYKSTTHFLSFLHFRCFVVCLTSSLGLLWMILIAPNLALAAGNPVTIHITGISHPPGFRPALVTVHVGDPLVFLNDAQPATTYTITASDQSFASPPIPPGQQWRVVFSSPGTHEYYALGNAQSMVGSIIVAPASVRLLSTPVPGAVATEITSIRTMRTHSSGSLLSISWPPSVTIVIVVALLLLLVGLAVSGLFLLRRRRHT